MNWILKTKDAAALLGMTGQYLNRLHQEKGLPREAEGRYDAVQIVHWMLADLRAKIDEAKAKSESERDAKSRFDTAKADRAELEVAEMQGRLIDVEAVKRVRAIELAAFKSKILGLPTKAATRILVCNGIAEIKALLDNEVRDALDELSREDPKKLLARAAGVRSEAGDSPTPSKRLPMGGRRKNAIPRVQRGTGKVDNGTSRISTRNA